MAQGRVWFGVGLLIAVAGTANAQPGVGSSFPASPPGALPPAFRPDTPSLAPIVPPDSGVQNLSAVADDHPPLKELPSGLPELIPPADKHHSEHEIPGYMTPFVPGHSGWYTEGEFLLMRPRTTNLDYAVLGINNGLSTVGPVESLGYNVGTGLRAEVGYRFGEGKWEAAFSYTYLEATGHDTIAAAPGEILFPTTTRPGLTDSALTAGGNTDLDYMLFDMLVARRMLIDDNFALRGLVGGRFADIRQVMNTYYNGGDARGASVLTRSRFQGFGPIVGLEGVLSVWRGFHLYSRATVGLVSGRNTNRLVETNDGGATTYVNTNYDLWKVVPMGSLALGFGWEYRTLALRAGYEVHQWQGIFERAQFTDDVSQGSFNSRSTNLTIQGVFFQAALSF